MKFLHLADLHIGKTVNAFPMIEDQKYILSQINDIIADVKPTAILIAGDVYDKTSPSDEAVRVLNEFLTGLIDSSQKVYMISGNHDSSAKLSFVSEILSRSNLYISPEYDGNTKKYTIEENGVVANIFLLPFIKPANIRAVYEDEDPKDYTEALKVAIDKMDVDESEINILVAHQFVKGAERTESEIQSVGGIDGVDGKIFDKFDYVALGHLHKPQNIGRETLRYSGTPLKYSLSEADVDKSVTVVEILSKDDIKVDTVPLKPLHDMRKIKGRYEELMDRSSYEGTDTEDYIHVTLTDEDEVPDVLARLRTVYPNIMSLNYENLRTSATAEVEIDETLDTKTPLEIWQEFYEVQNNQPMSEEQVEFSRKLIEGIWSDHETD